MPLPLLPVFKTDTKGLQCTSLGCNWQVMLQKSGSLGFRLATGVKNPAPVSRLVFEVESKQSAKKLFAHMMSVEGFKIIDPFHTDGLAQSRENPAETSALLLQPCSCAHRCLMCQLACAVLAATAWQHTVLTAQHC